GVLGQRTAGVPAPRQGPARTGTLSGCHLNSGRRLARVTSEPQQAGLHTTPGRDRRALRRVRLGSRFRLRDGPADTRSRDSDAQLCNISTTDMPRHVQGFTRMTGMSGPDYKQMTRDGGRSPDGWRSVSEGNRQWRASPPG